MRVIEEQSSRRARLRRPKSVRVIAEFEFKESELTQPTCINFDTTKPSVKLKDFVLLNCWVWSGEPEYK